MPSIFIRVGWRWRKSSRSFLVNFSDRLVRDRRSPTRCRAGRSNHRPVYPGTEMAPSVERLGLVEELGEVDIRDRPPAFAAGTHASGPGVGPPHRPGGTAFDGDGTASSHRGHVEGEGVGWADVGLPQPAEEDPQHGVGVGGGADRGAGVGSHPLLVDDDGGRQPFQYVDLGPGQRRHEALHEGAVGLIDQPLGLGGDGAEYQGALARAGNAGEHREPPLRDLDADVFEVVLACAVHPDEIVTVGRVPSSRRTVDLHVSQAVVFFDVLTSRLPFQAQAWAMRTMLPEGSRKAQSRTPQGWEAGSWSTSAPEAHTFSKVVSRSSERKIAA